MKKDMKELFRLLINRKRESIKLMFFLLLSILYLPMYNLYRHLLYSTFSEANAAYLNRFFFIVVLSLLIIYTFSKFKCYYRKNTESLILLGTPASYCLVIFLITNYEVLFLQTYIGSLLCQIHGMSFQSCLAVNLINAILVYIIGVFLALKFNSKLLKIFLIIFACILGVLFGTGNITYINIYKFVMSENIRQILFSDNYYLLSIKFFITIFLSSIIIWLYKKTDVDSASNISTFLTLNIIGDISRKLSPYSIYGKHYLRMYRNTDFAMWKFFSSMLLFFIYYITSNYFILLTFSYMIGLITSFYFKDIYNFERKLLPLYFMSNYAYKGVIRDFFVMGIYILGDNIVLILLIRSFFNLALLPILPIIILSIIFISFYVNSSLFAKYPQKQYNINIFKILLIMHVPILNVFILIRNLKQGKNNWENFVYEYK